MEDALVLTLELLKKGKEVSLNPCCNGRCTRTRHSHASVADG